MLGYGGAARRRRGGGGARGTGIWGGELEEQVVRGGGG